jgi:hypothetical protein
MRVLSLGVIYAMGFEQPARPKTGHKRLKTASREPILPPVTELVNA